MKSDSYRRFIRCDQYKELLKAPANKQKRLVQNVIELFVGLSFVGLFAVINVLHF